MVGGETKVVGDTLPGDSDLKVFLYMKAYRLVSACGLARVRDDGLLSNLRHE
jgi:hypothetical protein